MRRDKAPDDSVYAAAIRQVEDQSAEITAALRDKMIKIVNTIEKAQRDFIPGEAKAQTAVTELKRAADISLSNLPDQEKFDAFSEQVGRCRSALVVPLTRKKEVAIEARDAALARISSNIPEVADLAQQLETKERNDPHSEGNFEVRAIEKLTATFKASLSSAPNEDKEQKIQILTEYKTERANVSGIVNPIAAIQEYISDPNRYREPYNKNVVLTLVELKTATQQSSDILKDKKFDESRLVDPLNKMYQLALKEEMKINKSAPIKPMQLMEKVNKAAEKGARLLEEKMVYPLKLQERVKEIKHKVEQFKMNVEKESKMIERYELDPLMMDLAKLNAQLEAPIKRALSFDHFAHVATTGKRGKFDESSRKKMFEKLDVDISLKIKQIELALNNIKPVAAPLPPITVPPVAAVSKPATTTPSLPASIIVALDDSRKPPSHVSREREQPLNALAMLIAKHPPVKKIGAAGDMDAKVEATPAVTSSITRVR